MATNMQFNEKLLKGAIDAFVNKGDTWIRELFWCLVFNRQLSPDLSARWDSLKIKTSPDYYEQYIINVVQSLTDSNPDADFVEQVENAFIWNKFFRVVHNFVNRGEDWLVSFFDAVCGTPGFDVNSVDRNAIQTKVQELISKQNKSDDDKLIFMIFVNIIGDNAPDEFKNKFKRIWINKRAEFGPISNGSQNSSNNQNNQNNNSGNRNNNGSQNSSNNQNNQNNNSGNRNNNGSQNSSNNQNNQNNNSGNRNNNGNQNSSHNQNSNSGNQKVPVLNPEKYVKLLLNAKTQEGMEAISDIESQCIEEKTQAEAQQIITARGIDYTSYDPIEESGLISYMIMPLFPENNKGYADPGYVLNKIKSMGDPIKFSVKKSISSMLTQDYVLDQNLVEGLLNFVSANFKKYCNADLQKQLQVLLKRGINQNTAANQNQQNNNSGSNQQNATQPRTRAQKLKDAAKKVKSAFGDVISIFKGNDSSGNSQ